MGLGTLRRHYSRYARPESAGGTPLPEDFPGRAALQAAGYTTLEALRGLTQEELAAIKGIGPKLAQRILAALGSE